MLWLLVAESTIGIAAVGVAAVVAYRAGRRRGRREGAWLIKRIVEPAPDDAAHVAVQRRVAEWQ